MKRRLSLFAGFFLVFVSSISAQPKPLFRISVENTPSHVQAEYVALFAERLEEAFAGRIDVEFYHSGNLFRDRDVIAALQRGAVEMAVPGTWQLDRYVPEVALFLLPTFYGRRAELQHAVSDGELGREIDRLIGETLGVTVPGRWMDLGYAHLYFTERRVTRYEDIQDLRIRVAGGRANESRIGYLGGDPVSIPWANLPAQLDQDRVDGVLTTHETVRSGRLWNHGIRYVFEDSQYFPQYVPLVSDSFYRRLSAEDRALFNRLWNETVREQRVAARAAQARARTELLRHGIEIVVAPEAHLSDARERLLEHENEIAETLGIPRSVLSDLRRAVGE